MVAFHAKARYSKNDSSRGGESVRSFVLVAVFSFHCGCARFTTVHHRLAETTVVPSTCDGKKGDITFGTYNLAAAPGINRLSTLRVEAILTEFPKQFSDTDIVCLQEVWISRDLEQISRVLAESHPYQFFVNTHGENERGDTCEADDLEHVFSCVVRECQSWVDSPDLTTCAAMRCREEVLDLYPFRRSCFRCLVASVGRDLDSIRNTCVGGHGASNVYGGNNGVALFSKYPLHDTGVIRLPASGANRVALFARVEIQGKQPAELACTHLSSSESVPPTTGGILSTWEDERSHQLEIIEKRLQDRAGEAAIQFLVGDMNFGGERLPTIASYGERNWREALEFGFWSPAALADKPLCSFCAGNTISRWTTSILVDGVLVRSHDERAVTPLCVERVFTGRKKIGPAWENLSDHVGIKERFTIP